MADLVTSSCGRWRNTYGIGLFGFFSALVLYALTAAPTIGWGDSADLAMRLVYYDDTTFVGSHRDYALWRFFGQAAAWLPFDDAGFRANLYTAFWGAITVGAVTAFTHVVSRSAHAAIAAGCALAVAHSFWFLSVTAEVYTFNAAVVFLSFLCVALWWKNKQSQWLLPAAIFFGLSLSHHATGLVLITATVPLFIARYRQIRMTHGLLALFIFIAISWPYWSVVIPRVISYQSPLDALGLAMPQNPNFEFSVLREISKFVAYLIFNFFGISIILGLLGILSSFRCYAWVLLPPSLWAAAFIYAGVTSSIPDKFNVYVLVYPVFAIFVGLGFFEAVRRFSLTGRTSALLIGAIALTPPAFYFASVNISERFNLDLVGARKAPQRNNAYYFLFPPKNGDFGPRIFAENALQDMPKEGVLIADYTLWRPLYFVQAVEGIRPDVQLIFVERLLGEGVDNWIASQVCDRRIFLASNQPPSYYQLQRIEERFAVHPHGSIFEVVERCN